MRPYLCRDTKAFGDCEQSLAQSKTVVRVVEPSETNNSALEFPDGTVLLDPVCCHSVISISIAGLPSITGDTNEAANSVTLKGNT